MSAAVSPTLDLADLTAIVDIVAPRCGAIARDLEAGAAIGLTILEYARNLANGTQALLDALPPSVATDLRPLPARLHTALDVRDEQQAAA